MLGAVCSNLTIFKLEPTTPSMSQHIALKRWPNAHNMLRPTILQYVALACCDRSAGLKDGNGNSKNKHTYNLSNIFARARLV